MNRKKLTQSLEWEIILEREREKRKRERNKKLSYCWETVRRESMPRIAEINVEMTN